MKRGTPLGDDRRRRLRRRWSVITGLLTLGIFLEAIFAGAILSGADWANTAHRLTAAILVPAAIAAGVVSVVALRRVANGQRLRLVLLGLAVVVFLQAALGALSAKGTNLLWAHVPLGVALFGLAIGAVIGARRLERGLTMTSPK